MRAASLDIEKQTKILLVNYSALRVPTNTHYKSPGFSLTPKFSQEPIVG